MNTSQPPFANLDYSGSPMNDIATPAAASTTDWLWHGLVARKTITLLTSQWKAGKTTLITGLLQQFAAAGQFLGRAVAPSRVLVVSEESRDTWADRLRRMPVGAHCRLLARPFRGRPTPEEWNNFVAHAIAMKAAGELDLLVIDPLARFSPGASESDMKSLLTLLDPLQALCEAGAGVIILHHPRKKKSEEGNSARGTGALLAAVDIIVELSSCGLLRSDERRRKLFAISRYLETPRRLVYEWDPATGQFTTTDDPMSVRFKENWAQIKKILSKRTKAARHQELLADWPPDQECPSRQMLYHWLNLAYEEKLVRREGNGTNQDPYRYRLPTSDDRYRDRGELPPLKPLKLKGR